MSLEQVQEFAKRSTEILSKQEVGETISESDLVNHFLDALEYDVQQEVFVEDIGRPDVIVDISEGHSIVIEFKRSSRSLDKISTEQIKNYLGSDVDAEWGVLTNGREYHIYKRIEGAGRSQVLHIETLDLSELAEDPEPAQLLNRNHLSSLHKLSSATISRDSDTLGTWSSQLAGSAGPIVQAAEFQLMVEEYEGQIDGLHEFLLENSQLHPHSYRGYINNTLGIAGNIATAISDEDGRKLLTKASAVPAFRRFGYQKLDPLLFTNTTNEVGGHLLEAVGTNLAQQEAYPLSSVVDACEPILRDSADAYEAVIQANEFYTDGGNVERTDVISSAGLAATGLSMLSYGALSGDPITSINGAGFLFTAAGTFPEELLLD